MLWHIGGATPKLNLDVILYKNDAIDEGGSGGSSKKRRLGSNPFYRLKNRSYKDEIAGGEEEKNLVFKEEEPVLRIEKIDK